LDPLSPELALVDPDLAREARRRMPEYVNVYDGTAAAAFPLALVPARTPPQRNGDVAGVEIAAAPPGTAPQAHAPRHSRLAHPRWLMLAVSLLSASAGYGIAHATTRERVTSDLRRTGQPGRPAPSAAEPTTGARVPRPSTTSRARSDRRGLKPAPTRQAEGPVSFIWRSVPGASYYRVQFFRRDRKILEVFPSRPRFSLPTQWRYLGQRFRLTPGRFGWNVRAGIGPRRSRRYGPPIVQSTWLFKR
jgi:hypothetical protein